MTDFICVLLTAEGCGHCASSRGDGNLGNGRPLLTYKFLNEMLKITKNKHAEILNIHFQSMSGLVNQIESISKLYFTKNNIAQQEKYFRDKENNAFVNVRSLDYEEKSKLVFSQNVLIENKKITWNEFIRKKIPRNLERYTYFYPCFILFKKDDWKRGGNILGITSSGMIEEDEDGNYGLSKNPKTLNERNVPPRQLIIEALNNKLKFEPHIKKESNKDKKESNKDKKESNKDKKESNNSCSMIVKHYDDF